MMKFKEVVHFTEDRTVTLHYYDVPLVVPFWTKFLATDEDGEVWAFPTEPKACRLTWQPGLGAKDGVYDYCPVAIFKVPMEWAWQRTCVRYA